MGFTLDHLDPKFGLLRSAQTERFLGGQHHRHDLLWRSGVVPGHRWTHRPL